MIQPSGHAKCMPLLPVAVRYSPRPLESYVLEIRGLSCGPAASMLLKRSTAIWNLAWLGFDYEANAEHPFHPDPAYNVHVYHSCHWVMAMRSVDLSALVPEEFTLAAMLRHPAEAFVDWLLETAAYRGLPLYRTYGDAWLRTIQQRAEQAQDGDLATELIRTTARPVADTQQAWTVLQKFMR